MLTEGEAAAVEAVVRARAAWSPRPELCGRFGPEVVEHLVERRWLEAWSHPELDGEHVSLTPWAAERLGVELCEVTEFCAPRWVGHRMGAEGSVWGQWGRQGDGWPIHAARYAHEITLGLTLEQFDELTGLVDDRLCLERTDLVDGDEVTTYVEIFGLRVPRGGYARRDSGVPAVTVKAAETPAAAAPCLLGGLGKAARPAGKGRKAG